MSQDFTLKDFLKQFKSTVISTIDENGNPFTSYAPYIKTNGNFYVYISSIAKHSRNLEKQSKLSLFFIEDEISCENIFGRKRVVLQCDSKKLSRDTEEFEKLMEEFEHVHGKTVSMLKTMKDFAIFEFKPFAGEAVFGFGQAYDVGGENFEELVERKGQTGHKK